MIKMLVQCIVVLTNHPPIRCSMATHQLLTLTMNTLQVMVYTKGLSIMDVPHVNGLNYCIAGNF